MASYRSDNCRLYTPDRARGRRSKATVLSQRELLSDGASSKQCRRMARASESDRRGPLLDRALCRNQRGCMGCHRTTSPGCAPLAKGARVAPGALRARATCKDEQGWWAFTKLPRAAEGEGVDRVRPYSRSASRPARRAICLRNSLSRMRTNAFMSW